jgi:hypothetical protein
MYGALSDTTINICELSPYLYTMQWYIRGPGKHLQQNRMQVTSTRYPKPVDVHVVTDCEIIARQGNHEANRDVNGALWAGMDYFSRLNYNIKYHYYPRDQFAANRMCDALSKDMRHLITSIEQRLEEAVIPDTYDDHFGNPPVDTI